MLGKGKGSTSNVNFIETKTVKISQIIFDKNNPNVMSQIKNDALDHTVSKYGFAVDPWLNDQNNGKYLVIDGEHRIKLLQKKGIKQVQAKIFKVKYSEVRMLRQIANKLKGNHDRKKDAQEFKAIFDDGLLENFSVLIGDSSVELEKIINTEFNFESSAVETLEELDTQNKCPKCDYTW